METLEKIQRRVVGMISGLVAKDYESKLRELKLPSLRERRDRGDYIQAFWILRGVNSVEHEVWFDLATDRPRSGAAHTRGTGGVDALEPRKGRTDLRRTFFSVRTAEK